MAGTRKPSVKKKAKYLNNKDLMTQVLLSKDQGKMTDELANMLVMLCDRYAKKGNFSGYTFNDDMRGYAMYMLVRTWDSFNPKKSDNPFAFYTQCIKNSFRQYLKLEKRHREIRDVLLLDQGLNPSHTYMAEYEEEQAARSPFTQPEVDLDNNTDYSSEQDE